MDDPTQPPTPSDAGASPFAITEADAANNQLRAQRRDAFQRYIQTKWTQHVKCPICANESFNIEDEIEIPERSRAISPTTGQVLVYVFFPVGCTNCGYTMFFNSVQGELVPRWGSIPLP